MKRWGVVIGLLAGLGLVGCSGGGSGEQDDMGVDQATPNLITGVFVDSPVEGIKYKAQSTSGRTNAFGEFGYVEGEVIEFSIGNTVLPPVFGQPVITPVSFADGNLNSPVSINITRLLMTLDADSNPDNGIKLTSEYDDFPGEISFSVDLDEFSSDPMVLDLISISNSSGLISEADAREHLIKSISRLRFNELIKKATRGDVIFFSPEVTQNGTAFNGNASYATDFKIISSSEPLKIPYGRYSHAALYVAGDIEGGYMDVFHASPSENEEDEISVARLDFDVLYEKFLSGNIILGRPKGTTKEFRSAVLNSAIATFDSYSYIDKFFFSGNKTYCSKLVADAYAQFDVDMFDSDGQSASFMANIFFTPDELILSKEIEIIYGADFYPFSNIGDEIYLRNPVYSDDFDGDGYANLDDQFPSDPNEYNDFDGDGVGDFADEDDDNDGIWDIYDLDPRDKTIGSQDSEKLFYNPCEYCQYSGPFDREWMGDSTTHLGQDYPAKIGDPVVAVSDGVVSQYYTSISGFGGYEPSRPGPALVIKHWKSDGDYFYVLYGHVEKSSNIEIGSRVMAGEVIGTVADYLFGSDESIQSWPHLHLGIWDSQADFPTSQLGYGEIRGFVDPEQFLATSFPFDWDALVPTGLKVSDTASSEIRIEWNESELIDKYNVYYSNESFYEEINNNDENNINVIKIEEIEGAEYIIESLTDDENYFISISAITLLGLETDLSSEVLARTKLELVATSKLNDTGITLCGNYDAENEGQWSSTLNCADTGATQTSSGTDQYGNIVPAGQDAHYGRDALAASGQLTKVGGGAAGFDFTKLDASGTDLPATATEWSCVRDNVTGLIWEVKDPSNGNVGDSLHDADDTYNWYNTDSSTNGGSVGNADDDGAICYGYDNADSTTYCNTEAFVNRVNTAGLCGADDWRMPKKEELRSIVHYGRANPSIDTDYFPNTGSNWYWSGSPSAATDYRSWQLGFYDGYDYDGRHTRDDHVRLVRFSK